MERTDYLPRLVLRGGLDSATIYDRVTDHETPVEFDSANIVAAMVRAGCRAIEINPAAPDGAAHALATSLEQWGGVDVVRRTPGPPV